VATASIIVPAYNAADLLPKCLAALRPALSSTTDLVVVDDGSTDGTAATAEALGARVVRRPTRGGPAVARNLGVARTTGAILVFVDADVEVAPGAVARIVETLDGAPELAGVFGSYDARPSDPGLVSQFRNLLHHYVHQQSQAEAFTFWAGFGALRREAFAAVGGFDEGDRRTVIEDIDLGYRLCAAGHRLRLDRTLLCTHRKRWTLASMVWADVVFRAIPWSRLVLRRGGAPRDLNLTGAQRASVALVGLFALALPLLAWEPARWVAGCSLAGIILLNWRFYAFLRRVRGVRFAAASVPLHVVHLFCAGFGFAWAWIETRLGG
jgi:glycosyltransferase involved in cell wall biosynthesis